MTWKEPNVLLSIDLSLRAAGWVILQNTGELVDFGVLATTKEMADDESLLVLTDSYFTNIVNTHKVGSVVIEGLAFAAKSSRSDLIAGNWWHLRASLYQNTHVQRIGSIPVTAWRNRVLNLTKNGREELKKFYGDDYLKAAVFDKLPQHVAYKFVEYTETLDYPKGYPSNKKKEAKFDLADAYFLGQHRLSLGNV